jgi:hypothetical protein
MMDNFIYRNEGSELGHFWEIWLGPTRDLQEGMPTLCIGGNYPREGEVRNETACMAALFAIRAMFENILVIR